VKESRRRRVLGEVKVGEKRKENRRRVLGEVKVGKEGKVNRRIREIGQNPLLVFIPISGIFFLAFFWLYTVSHFMFRYCS